MLNEMLQYIVIDRMVQDQNWARQQIPINIR